VHTAAELGVGALAAVVERSRDGIVVVTADRRYVYANPAACRIMGCSLAAGVTHGHQLVISAGG
jgi:PAS domain-containing protein